MAEAEATLTIPIGAATSGCENHQLDIEVSIAAGPTTEASVRTLVWSRPTGSAGRNTSLILSLDTYELDRLIKALMRARDRAALIAERGSVTLHLGEKIDPFSLETRPQPPVEPPPSDDDPGPEWNSQSYDDDD